MKVKGNSKTGIGYRKNERDGKKFLVSAAIFQCHKVSHGMLVGWSASSRLLPILLALPVANLLRQRSQ
jgi:hypothetical protein